jgi:hypothetical protein
MDKKEERNKQRKTSRLEIESKMQRSAICTSGRALLGGRVSLATACNRPVGIVGRYSPLRLLS